MKMDYNISFNCFHGTIKHFSDEIIKSRKFTIKKRNDHWLGSGVYFFINDKSKAEWWAKETRKLAKRNIGTSKSPVDTTRKILYLEANLNNRDLLDLDTEDGQRKFSEFNSHLERHNFKFIRSTDDSATEHQARCEILDLLVEVESYKACSYTFESDRDELYKGTKKYGILNKGKQLSVYDQTIIDFDTLKVL
ncbi:MULTISPECIES: hypothetical protein [unclassified Sporosarcina]|uniref:hypothetical protein n=1 Tax=unclassified Sporosarcina TaxID=2647733 RepID=UPI00203ADC48|nr:MULTISPECIES: hypothetical protein [unclassified Sporosarcina]GKV66153.1 hypothetical protein NCCP2331_23060 [Sporosarcina sp. NCCP-2331]GLB56239.1 hypothetical protein NCCP2378_20260 [Sporosarcina sp. NCCP-2378]